VVTTPEVGARTALVTGIGGQDGIYLSHSLLGRGYKVLGMIRPGGSTARLSTYLPEVETVPLDMRDVEGIAALLKTHQPSEIYNLAALSSVGASWQEAELVAEINAMSVLRFLELLLRFRDSHHWGPRFYQASSSEMFGLAESHPQNEATAHHPRSPYAAAKSFAHNITVNYRESYDLFLCSGILFNHESPLRPERFVTRKITKAVAEIALGRRESVTLGNLDVKRDWGAAADYVEAMWSMMQQPNPDDFVIATGVSRPLLDVVRAAFSAAGIEDVEKYVTHDPSLRRPSDVPELRGDSSKAARLLGWHPQQTFSGLISHMVWADIERIRSGEPESLRLLDPVNAFRSSWQRRSLTTNHDRHRP